MVCECPFSPGYPDPQKRTPTEHNKTKLTVVPSRSSPGAKTCRAPHKCGENEPALAWASEGKEKQNKRKALI